MRYSSKSWMRTNTHPSHNELRKNLQKQHKQKGINTAITVSLFLLKTMHRAPVNQAKVARMFYFREHWIRGRRCAFPDTSDPQDKDSRYSNYFPEGWSWHATSNLRFIQSANMVAAASTALSGGSEGDVVWWKKQPFSRVSFRRMCAECMDTFCVTVRPRCFSPKSELTSSMISLQEVEHLTGFRLRWVCANRLSIIALFLHIICDFTQPMVNLG